jgi:hypothetical protein
MACVQAREERPAFDEVKLRYNMGKQVITRGQQSGTYPRLPVRCSCTQTFCEGKSAEKLNGTLTMAELKRCQV